MPKKVVILVRSCPYGIATAGEAFRAASGLAGLDHKVNVIFIEDGVFTALKGQNPEIIDMPDVSQAYKEIGEFGAETWIAKRCMEIRNISLNDLEFGKVANMRDIKQMLDAADSVLSFS